MKAPKTPDGIAKIKVMVAKADDSILDDLLGACEGRMSSKWKPKEEESPMEDMQEGGMEEMGEMGGDDELSDDEIEKIIMAMKAAK